MVKVNAGEGTEIVAEMPENWFDAVSYTHLDVYKRQGLMNGTKLQLYMMAQMLKSILITNWQAKLLV